MSFKERARAWVGRWWRALLGEALGSALLVALGVGSLAPARGQPAPLTHPALAFAFVVTALVQALGPVSGAHLNPAVTLAALLAGRLPAAAAPAYVLAQLAGAVAGFGALQAVAPAFREGALGCTLPAGGAGPAAALAALAVEAALTGTLALVASAVWAAHDDARPDHAAPLKLGLTVGGLVYAGGELTGASLNPARSLAPALLLAQWDHHWVYWAGPLAGAAVAALAHRHVLLPRPAARQPPPAAPEALPLHDKRDCC